MLCGKVKPLGTQTLRENKKLKGSLSKLEALNDMGVLSPKEMDDFMKTFVEDKLNISLTVEEAKKLSELTTKQEELFNSITKDNNWTFTNTKEITRIL